MKKLTLKLEDLSVETFRTDAESAASGTVVGHNPTVVDETCSPSCPYTCGIIMETAECRFGPDTAKCPVCG